MKRIVLCAVLIIAAVGCQPFDPVVQPTDKYQPEYVEMTFSAESEASSSTRAAVDPDNNNVYWFMNDTINVFDVNPNPAKAASFIIVPDGEISYPIHIDDRTGEPEDEPIVPGAIVEPSNPYPTEVTFSGTIPGSTTGYYAVYPFKDYTTYDDDPPYGLYDGDDDGTPETLRLEWSGHRQCPAQQSFESNKGMMVAYTTGTTLNFKNVFAYFKFTTEFPCDEIIIEGRNGEELTAMDIFVQMQGDPGSEVPVIVRHTKAPWSDGSANIRHESEYDHISPGTFLVAVLPQTLSNGFRITFKNPNGVDKFYNPYRETTKSVTLTRGRILNLGTFDDGFISNVTEWEGNGTSASPYEIRNLAQLTLLANRVNGSQHNTYAGKYYKLMEDINCDGRQLTAIGKNESKAFSGYFDGNGHAISNYIPGYANHSTGLFAYARNAHIHDLTLLVRKINTDFVKDDNHAYSPLVGTAVKTSDSDVLDIRNCHIDEYGDSFLIRVGNYRVFYGGIIGWARSNVNVIGCTNDCKLELDRECWYRIDNDCSIGGILGAATDFSGEIHVKIHCCRNNADLKMEASGDANIGGIVGCQNDYHEIGGYDVIPIITDCVNRGNLTINESGHFAQARDSNIGGMVGKNDTDGYHSEDPYIVNCLNAGRLHSCGDYMYVGGMIGWCYDDDTQVENCANNTNYVFGSSMWYAKCGAICGERSGWFKRCHWIPRKDYGYGIVPYLKTYDYDNQTGCSEVSEITSEMMNANVSKITPLLGRTYCTWIGSGSTLDLDF